MTEEKHVAEGDPVETLSEYDKLTLELAKMNRKVALANAQTTLAQNDLAELSYKYLLLKLYMKYKLDTEKDVMDENGIIMRGYLKKKEEE